MKKNPLAGGLLACALSLAAMPLWAQPTQPHKIEAGTRQPTADEQQVVMLMNQSASLADQGRLDEAVTVGARALALARKTKMREITAAALLHTGMVDYKRGQHPQALEAIRQALLLCEIEGSLTCQANVRLVKADVLGNTGQPEQALREREMSRKLSQASQYAGGVLNAVSAELNAESGDPATKRQRAESLLAQSKATGSTVDEALALRQLGRDAMEAGDYGRAQGLFEEALSRTRTAVNPRAEADSLVALGQLAMARRKLPEASALLEQALAAATKSGSQGAIGNALLFAAETHMMAGEKAAMRDKATRALAAYVADSQPMGQGLAHQTLGDADWLDGRRDDAQARYREAARLAAVSGNATNQAGAHLRLATLLRATDAKAAMAESEKAAELYTRAGLKSGMADTLLEQAWIHGAAKDLPATIEKARRSRAMFEELRRPAKVARADFTLAAAFRMSNQLGEAAVAIDRSVTAYRQLGMADDEAKALLEHAEILGRMGGPAETAAAAAATARAQALTARNPQRPPSKDAR